MRIAILGFASQGQAAYEYWNKANNQITICDQDPDTKVPEGADTQLGPDYLKNLDQFDLLIRTPALHPKDIVAANDLEILDKVTTVTNEFFKVCPTKNIIGVTGTKGKGTTSTLIAKILEAAGKTVHLGGNIGTPPLDMLNPPAGGGIKDDDWVVLELANFQLVDLKHSPHIAVCLMVVAEHLNWHDDITEYVTAKQQLFMHQITEDLAVFNRANAHSAGVASVSLASKVSYEVPGPGAEPTNHEGAYLSDGLIYMNDIAICKASDIALLGRHNLENVCAAIAATWDIVGHSTEIINKVITSFTGLEHRLELVREVNGVKYYDDSFGTTPETAIVALQAFEQPKVLILGGSTKESEYETLAQVITSNSVRQVILIGNTAHPVYKTAAPDLEAALKAAGVENVVSTVKPGGVTMTEIVDLASKAAQPGDVVLLSTGCASFDMFENYQDRGQKFKQAVLAL